MQIFRFLLCFYSIRPITKVYIFSIFLHCILYQVFLPFMKTLTAPGRAGVQRPHAGVQAQDKRCPWCQQRTCPPACHHFMRQWEDQRQIQQQQAFLEMPRKRNYKKRWRQHSKFRRKFIHVLKNIPADVSTVRFRWCDV